MIVDDKTIRSINQIGMFDPWLVRWDFYSWACNHITFPVLEHTHAHIHTHACMHARKDVMENLKKKSLLVIKIMAFVYRLSNLFSKIVRRFWLTKLTFFIHNTSDAGFHGIGQDSSRCDLSAFLVFLSLNIID